MRENLLSFYDERSRVKGNIINFTGRRIGFT